MIGRFFNILFCFFDNYRMTTTTESPKLTLPKIDPSTVSSVLDFLHPTRD